MATDGPEQPRRSRGYTETLLTQVTSPLGLWVGTDLRDVLGDPRSPMSLMVDKLLLLQKARTVSSAGTANRDPGRAP